jgi:hypothetical protein
MDRVSSSIPFSSAMRRATLARSLKESWRRSLRRSISCRMRRIVSVRFSEDAVSCIEE